MGSDRGSGGTDRSREIAAVSDAVYDAMGVTGSRVAFEYDRRPSTECASALDVPAGLGEGQAWYATQAFVLAPGQYDYDALFDAATRHFAAQGYQTRTYRKSTNLRALSAVKGDVGVVVTVPPLQVTVAAGPCGSRQSEPGASYVPEG
jgi:hypothetical protein